MTEEAKNIVVWEADPWFVNWERLHDNVGYNPWQGYTVTGWPEHVLLRGQILMKHGAFFGQPGTGNWIDRPVLATKPNGRTL